LLLLLLLLGVAAVLDAPSASTAAPATSARAIARSVGRLLQVVRVLGVSLARDCCLHPVLWCFAWLDRVLRVQYVV
jgi:hypothetical protein